MRGRGSKGGAGRAADGNQRAVVLGTQRAAGRNTEVGADTGFV